MRPLLPPRIARRTVALTLAAAVSLWGGGTASSPALSPRDSPAFSVDLHNRGWVWPVHPVLVSAPFAAPAHRYGTGHRGIDLRPLETAELRAPASGVVAFRGVVAGRGVLTIDHGDGLITTLEPIDSSMDAGTWVDRGEAVGTVALGGHSAPGTVHFGVRLDGEYINPLLLLGGVPRAILLPCC
jgi:murein DD-endopeptidase MepM/ murein hydrolase activator NlpD